MSKRICLLHVMILFIKIIHSQEARLGPVLVIGDMAPPLLVSEWIKGKPVQQFKLGQVYVVEFWATWCPPCIKVMPHLSKLAHKYKKSVTIVSINVLEKKKYPREKARALIDSMERSIKYSVAFEDSNFMESTWLNASDEYGIPSSFVVNTEGKIAWIGHPLELKKILPKILDNSWDINTAFAKRDFKNCIYNSAMEAREEFIRFFRKGSSSDFFGEPDSALFYIDRVVSKDPDLKYATSIAYHTFVALLKTDMEKAYKYANEGLQSTSPLTLSTAREAIINGIGDYTKDLDNITAEIFRLGAETINQYAAKSPKNLMVAAEWYYRAGDKLNARLFLKKARKAMKAAKFYGLGRFF